MSGWRTKKLLEGSAENCQSFTEVLSDAKVTKLPYKSFPFTAMKISYIEL